uniref:Addiction module antidote protein, HigA family n=1 Tax=Candidatus Kentrum sp. MB TaxID=2138164 RepID=A0A450Y2Y0_9GAMM|nr:MAG: addiction module antidote protein, HigA family [Candidatus Kentron sp. MB]VFK35895.1 MAG: addiction module antidote protein, HigA family [Candidatus Kentron sp. MB]VFK77540.1 MAG: addiction module antidote protein, HigA family [Candidatus Kentron sp. MB]
MTNYQPDFAIHPGEHLEEALETSKMTQSELATRLGIHKKTINEIIKGKASITSEVALRLGKVFHYPAHLWNNLQRNHDETIARLAEQQRLKRHQDWLHKIPIKEMVKHRWIQAHDNHVAQLDEVLRFFGIASPGQWRAVWETHQVAYRQSQRFEPSALAVSAWLRQGEIQAHGIACAPFDRKAFQSVLDQARALTRDLPEVFQGSLVSACARVGVALVFVPELPKTGVSGCTRWLGGKAVIQLSLRYKSNDQLWFTFFHEAGHILKHGRKAVFLEDGKGLNDKKEEEANAFARDKLIPPAAYRRFLAQWDGQSLAPVEAFAEEIGIAPGIIVGRLQFDKQLPNSHGNRLKVFYAWEKQAES